MTTCRNSLAGEDCPNPIHGDGLCFTHALREAISSARERSAISVTTGLPGDVEIDSKKLEAERISARNRTDLLSQALAEVLAAEIECVELRAENARLHGELASITPDLGG